MRLSFWRRPVPRVGQSRSRRPWTHTLQKHEADLSPLRRGNLAARLRSVILFDQSAKFGALPLGTGNKSERLLGYYTWHADDSPPINPLGDLFKTQVWDLARHLGVPDVIIDKPASADLVRGVHDEDELGISYHRADPILHWLLNGYSADELKQQRILPEAMWTASGVACRRHIGSENCRRSRCFHPLRSASST